MADRVLYTNEAALAEAGQIARFLGDPAASPPTTSRLRLFTSALVPIAGTTRAELLANEASFVGYPSGGYTLTDWQPPLFAPGGGAVILSEKIDVFYTSGSPVTIGGYWVEDSNGNVRLVYVYDPPRTLAVVGDGWPIIPQLGYGRNII
jgi:hypothetical protein